MRLRHLSFVLMCLTLLAAPHAATAQTAPPPQAPAPTPAAPRDRTPQSKGVLGLMFTVSTFGAGGDAAIRLGGWANIRAGYSAFSLTQDFDDSTSKITYTGKLDLKAGRAFLDLYPFAGGFHISPGVVFANRTRVTLSSTLTAGQKITIDGVEYTSSATTPLRASGTVSLQQVKPAVVIGWGNLVPAFRRAAFLIEAGAVFGDPPTTTLGLTGLACNANGANCRDAATDPAITAGVKNDQARLAKDLKVLRYYPIVTVGLGFRF
jgi:hypothetical protein